MDANKQQTYACLTCSGYDGLTLTSASSVSMTSSLLSSAVGVDIAAVAASLTTVVTNDSVDGAVSDSVVAAA